MGPGLVGRGHARHEAPSLGRAGRQERHGEQQAERTAGPQRHLLDLTTTARRRQGSVRGLCFQRATVTERSSAPPSLGRLVNATTLARRSSTSAGRCTLGPVSVDRPDDATAPGDRDIVARYSRLAFIYDFWTWMTERRSRLAALSRAGIRDGEEILEIAVGTGFVFREMLLRNPSGQNVGIDVTEAMLRRTRRKAERTGVPFVLEIGDGRALSFDADSFDLVLSNNMLGLLPKDDVLLVLREMLRVLRPGGRIVLATMSCPARRVPGWIYRLGAKRLGAWRDVQLDPLVRVAGFADARGEVVSQLGIPTEVLVAQKPTASS